MKFFYSSTVIFLAAAVVSQCAFASLTFSRAVPNGVKRQMTKDLQFVSAIQGGATSKTYVGIFGRPDLSGPRLLQFFEKRIFSIDLDDCGGGGTIACVNTNSNPNEMLLTDYFTKSDMSQILRIGLLFHESRHSEVAHGGWPHAICPTPYLDEQNRDIISKVNGQTITTSNYVSLLYSGGTTFSFGLAEVQNSTLVDTDLARAVTATVFQANPV
ncbi:MAG: hypothetical protein EOP06_26665, partial [Proteobacteria bacterium]